MTINPVQTECDARGRLSVSQEQRDLLFERIVRNLSRVDDLLLAVRSGDHETAERLGLDLYREVTLITKDLGWGARTSDGSFDISTPPILVRSVLTRIRDEAKALDPYIDVRDDSEENQELIRACDELLETLRLQKRPRDAGDLPLDDDQTTQKEILRLLFRSYPKELREEEICDSICKSFDLSVVEVGRALGQLRELALVDPGQSGLVATEGAVRISQLWDLPWS